MRKTLQPSLEKNFTKGIDEQMATPRGRRFFAWDMVKPILGNPYPGPNEVGPWENYPDSPKGTLEVWEEKETGRHV